MRKLVMLKTVAAFAGLAAVTGACGVGDFFSSTWAPDENRISRSKPQNAAEAAALVEKAKNDPAISRELLDKIAALAGSAGGDEKNKLLGTAAAAAIQAGNMTGLIAGNVDQLNPSSISGGDIKDVIPVISDVVGKALENYHVDEVAARITDLYLPEIDHFEDIAAAMGDTAEERDAVLGQLALTLIAGQINPDTGGDALSEWAGSEKDFESFENAEDAKTELRAIFGESLIMPGDEALEAAIGGDASLFDTVLAVNPSLQVLDAVIGAISIDTEDSAAVEKNPLAGSLAGMWKAMKGDRQ
jgi:hypothetical protein